MSKERDANRYFMVSDIKKGSPVRIPVGTFAALNADERKDIQRWIKIVPEIVDPDIVIVGEEVSHWDKSKKRPDLLGVDRDGKLVVIELKRKASDKEHDLQVLRYASFVSTLSLEQVVELFAAFKEKEGDGASSEAEARKELEDFTGGAINAVDESEDPRIILVAPGFRQEVMSTVLWLRKYGLDISCVRLEPLEISGKAVLSATTIVPLPEASEYEIGLREKQQAASAKRRPIDRDQVREFIASIPEGRWASYGDVADAAGSSSATGAQGIGSMLRSGEPGEIPLVYRVLDKNGMVSRGWIAEDPTLPQTPEEVQEKLQGEGVTFLDGRASERDRWRAEDWLAQKDRNPALD